MQYFGGPWAYVRPKCSHILKVYALKPCVTELKHKMSEHEAQHEGTNIALLPYAANKRSAWRSLASSRELTGATRLRSHLETDR